MCRNSKVASGLGSVTFCDEGEKTRLYFLPEITIIKLILMLLGIVAVVGADETSGGRFSLYW